MPLRSLSHSGGCAAIAIAPTGCRAGVDIETMVPRDIHGISRFAFSVAEARALNSLDLPAALARFYVLWTLKEAFAKALGMPLLAALRECSFTRLDGCWTADIPAVVSWRAAVFVPRPGWALAAVILGTSDALQLDWTCREWPGPTETTWPRLATLGGEGSHSPR